MNLAQVKAWGGSHRTALLGGSAGAVALVAVARRRKTTAVPAPATDTSAARMAGQSFTGAASVGGVGMDTSATDVYNALQPQIEANQSLLQKVWDKVTGIPEMVNQAVTAADITGQVTNAIKATPIPVAPAPAPAPTPAPPAPAAPEPRTYTVVRGDNLSRIAQRYYGTADWNRIYGANRGIITNPNLIYPGQTLVIP